MHPTCAEGSIGWLVGSCQLGTTTHYGAKTGWVMRRPPGQAGAQQAAPLPSISGRGSQQTGKLTAEAQRAQRKAKSRSPVPLREAAATNSRVNSKAKSKAPS